MNAVRHRNLVREALADELLTTAEASASTGLTEAWLRKQRSLGRGPGFVRVGGCVRYVRTWLQRWLEANMEVVAHGVR
jgi:hypothetical protein